MRWLLFILLAFLISCKSLVEPKKKKSIKSIRHLKASGPNYDSSDLKYMDGLEEINGKIITEDIIVELPSYDYHIDDTRHDSEVKPNIKKTDSIIIDDRVDADDSTKGIIAYNVPDRMIVRKNHQIKVRITKDRNNKQSLIIGADGQQPITKIDKSIILESIRIESIMSAELISVDQTFEITSTSTKEQNIEDHGYTEWSWNVKPTKSGIHPLKLLIKVRTINEHGGFYKDIVVFERDITIEANISHNAVGLLKLEWKWLFTTILIPIFLWWRKKKSKK